MKNDSDEKTIVFRQTLANLSIDNLLTKKVTDIDTWPFRPRGVIQPDRDNMFDKEKDKINKDWEMEFQNILNSVTSRLRERQILIVSFSLAIITGVLGNLAVSFLFGSISFQIANAIYLVIILAIIAILAGMIVLYVHLSLNYGVQFMPPWRYPEMSLPELAEDKLSPKGRLETSYPSSFTKLVLDYTNLLTIVMLRDHLKEVAFKNLRIVELHSPPDFPFYTITIDFKHQWLFWKWNIPEAVSSELSNLNTQLMLAKIFIGVHALDINPDRWLQRGHIFINEVSQWNMNDARKRIESQIMSINA